MSESVGVSRKHQIDAAIVRIMKANQTLSHAQLVAEVLTLTLTVLSVCMCARVRENHRGSLFLCITYHSSLAVGSVVPGANR